MVDADFQSYYDTIPRPPLMERVRSKVADSKVLALLEAFLGQAVTQPALPTPIKMVARGRLLGSVG